MKYALLSLLLVTSCATTTTTSPDGTVTKTEAIDKDALATGAEMARLMAERNSGK